MERVVELTETGYDFPAPGGLSRRQRRQLTARDRGDARAFAERWREDTATCLQCEAPCGSALRYPV